MDSNPGAVGPRLRKQGQRQEWNDGESEGAAGRIRTAARGYFNCSGSSFVVVFRKACPWLPKSSVLATESYASPRLVADDITERRWERRRASGTLSTKGEPVKPWSNGFFEQFCALGECYG